MFIYHPPSNLQPHLSPLCRHQISGLRLRTVRRQEPGGQGEAPVVKLSQKKVISPTEILMGLMGFIWIYSWCVICWLIAGRSHLVSYQTIEQDHYRYMTYIYLNPPMGSLLTHDLQILGRNENFRSDCLWYSNFRSQENMNKKIQNLRSPILKSSKTLVCTMEVPKYGWHWPKQCLIGYLWALYAGNFKSQWIQHHG